MNLIRIDKPVTFLLPFDRYSLTLSHRLLDSMGGVSRFLLRAIEQQLSLAALIDITALSEAVLLNQLAYLQAHHYLQVEESVDGLLLWLTPRGASIVQVERLLEGSRLSIWMDAFTLSGHAAHMMMLDDCAKLAPPMPDSDAPSAVVVNVPRRTGRAGRARLFDDANRLRGLLEQSGLKQLLEHCWGADCELIASEFEHWAFELGKDEGEQAELQVPVEYAAGELLLRLKASGNQCKPGALPLLTLPVIELTHSYNQVAHFPWSVDLPPTCVQRIELVSSGTLNRFAENAVAEAEDARHSKLPMSPETAVPAALGTVTVRPGISMQASVRTLRLLCSMDEVQFSRHLQCTPDALVLSHNLMTTETAELA